MATHQQSVGSRNRSIWGYKLFNSALILVGSVLAFGLSLFADLDGPLSLWALLYFALLPIVFWALGVTFMYVRYYEGETSLWTFLK